MTLKRTNHATARATRARLTENADARRLSTKPPSHVMALIRNISAAVRPNSRLVGTIINRHSNMKYIATKPAFHSTYGN